MVFIAPRLALLLASTAVVSVDALVIPNRPGAQQTPFSVGNVPTGPESAPAPATQETMPEGRRAHWKKGVTLSAKFGRLPLLTKPALADKHHSSNHKSHHRRSANPTDGDELTSMDKRLLYIGQPPKYDSHGKHHAIHKQGDLLDVHATLDARGLLDPLEPLLDGLAPLLGAITPILKGLPIIPGVIDILGPALKGLLGDKIAGLVLGKSGAPPTAGATSLSGTTIAAALPSTATHQFVFNASNSTAQTRLFLVPQGNTTNEDGTMPVALVLPVFRAGSASVVPYCATYDANPPSPAPLTAEPCRNDTSTIDPNAPSTMSAQSTGGFVMNQIFSYSPDTGVIKPMWGNNDTSSSNNTTTEGAAAMMDGGSATLPQTVTLVFSAAYPTTNETTPDDGSASPATPDTPVTPMSVNAASQGKKTDAKDKDDGSMGASSTDDDDATPTTSCTDSATPSPTS